MARKQAETDRLRKRIASLDKTVESIVTEFIHFGDRRVNSSQPLSGIPQLDDLKQTTRRILDYARTAESLANEEGSESISDTLPFAEVSSTSTTSQLPSSSSPIEVCTPFTASKYFPVIGFPPSRIQTGHFSPRLGYGLLNKTAQVGAAEEFLSHYSVAGPNSFALRLYKDTITLSIRILQGEISIPGFIPSLMRYRFRYEKSDNYVTRASNFLERLSLQDSAMDTENESGIILFSPSHPVMNSVLRVTMYQDLVQEVGSVGEWLDPYNTQLHLQNRWGLKLTASTARLSATSKRQQGEIRGNSEAGQFVSFYDPGSGLSDSFVEESSPVLPAQSLAESLIRKSVCFGEGPRFYKGNIDPTAAEFLARVGDL
jgi:hypothetical protein